MIWAGPSYLWHLLCSACCCASLLGQRCHLIQFDTTTSCHPAFAMLIYLAIIWVQVQQLYIIWISMDAKYYLTEANVTPERVFATKACSLLKFIKTWCWFHWSDQRWQLCENVTASEPASASLFIISYGFQFIKLYLNIFSWDLLL